MEQARVLIAIALSFLVFILWEAIFVDRENIPQPPPTGEAQKQAPPAEQETLAYQAGPETSGKSGNADTVESVSTKKDIPDTVVDTPLYSVEISAAGAIFKSFVLKKYKERTGDDAPLKELISEKAKKGNLRCSFADNGIPGLDGAIFGSPHAGRTVEVRKASRNITFSWTSPEGIVLEKEFKFSPESYMIEMTVRVKNGSGRAVEDRLSVSLENYMDLKGASYGFEGVSGLIDGDLKEIKIDDIEDENVHEGNIKWMAIETIYFMTSIVPKDLVPAKMVLSEQDEHFVETSYLAPERKIAPGTQIAYQYDLFFGPKRLDTLRKAGHDLDRAVNFGMFDILAKPCLWIMNFIHDYIPNYGIAIIILTIFTKIILWPLGNKSYKSMAEMKKLQPLMAEIREKYKDDKKKMNQETMALYKTYKVNPVGGCLPMALQIPVFFALYRMLYEAIELRHAPFFLWINDLSAPDRLFRFDFAIPMMEPPYGIPVLTLVMGATMFLQQKMTPTAGDPAQAKLMTFMPLVFTVIFINFSSGLVLYWLVNNLLSIGQQYYVQQKK